MKFRCERDTLADALSTAQRAVASRTGALPVLFDVRITATSGDRTAEERLTLIQRQG